MERQPVKSSNVASIGHDPATGILEVEFKNGGIYHYHGVPAESHQKLMAAESIGKHLNQHIKGVHQHTRVGDAKVADAIQGK